jgi:hypothetical protein
MLLADRKAATVGRMGEAEAFGQQEATDEEYAAGCFTHYLCRP